MSYAKLDNWVSRPLAYETVESREHNLNRSSTSVVCHRKIAFIMVFRNVWRFKINPYQFILMDTRQWCIFPGKKGVCRGRAAFHITFQHKTTFSLKTSNRPMNSAMLPKYHIGKIPPICSISAIFVHKSHYAGFLHGVFGNPNCYFVSD